MASQVTVRLGINHLTKFGPNNPVGGKEFQEQLKELVKLSLPLLSVLQEHQATNHNLYAENLGQTHMLATSVSVSPCEPCLVHSVGHSFGVLHPL